MDLVALSGLIALIFYVFACLVLYRQFRGQAAPSRWTILAPGTFAALAHGLFLCLLMVTGNGLKLGLFPVASMVAFTGVVVVLISSLYRPFEWISALVYPFAALTLPAALWIKTGYTAHALSHGVGLHVLFSITAYAVLALAACQAILLFVQHRQLKQGDLRGVMRLFPPIQVMESMLFEAIWLGETLLTVAILSGALFMEDMFAQHLVHKTVLTLVAWVVFAILLAGRHLQGWRGTTAIRITLAGFAVLLVGFFGSQVALELILKR